MTAWYCHCTYYIHHPQTLPRLIGSHQPYVPAICIAIQLGFLTNAPFIPHYSYFPPSHVCVSLIDLATRNLPFCSSPFRPLLYWRTWCAYCTCYPTPHGAPLSILTTVCLLPLVYSLWRSALHVLECPTLLNPSISFTGCWHRNTHSLAFGSADHPAPPLTGIPLKANKDVVDMGPKLQTMGSWSGYIS